MIIKKFNELIIVLKAKKDFIKIPSNKILKKYNNPDVNKIKRNIHVIVE